MREMVDFNTKAIGNTKNKVSKKPNEKEVKWLDNKENAS